jgi:Fic family protein
MKKQPRIRVEPVRVRYAEIIRRLKGVPHTIKEVSRILDVDYYTARRYLAELYECGYVEKLPRHNRPLRYYAPLRNRDEQPNQIS